MQAPVTELPTNLAKYYTLKEKLSGEFYYQSFIIEHQKNQKKFVMRAYPLSDVLTINTIKTRLFEFYKLSHSRVSSLTHYIWDDENIYLVFDAYSGQSLYDFVKTKEKLELPLFFKFAKEILEAVNYIHQLQISLLDVTPQSMMLDSDLHLHLAPIYLECEKQEGTFFSHRLQKLTPFTAPECILNRPGSAVQTDLYALGACFYWLLAGKTPFENNPSALQELILTQDIPPIRNLREEVPKLLEQFVMELLSREPALRPQNTSQVLQELKRIESRVTTKKPRILPQNKPLKRKLKKPKLIQFNQISQVLAQNYEWVENFSQNLKAKPETLSWKQFETVLTSAEETSYLACVDQNWFLLVYQGVVLGAVDLNYRLKNSFALESMKFPKSVKAQPLGPDSAPILLLLNQVLNLEHMDAQYSHTSKLLKHNFLNELAQEKQTGCLVTQHFESDKDKKPVIYLHFFVNGHMLFRFGISLKAKQKVENVSLEALWQKSYCWSTFLPVKLFLGFQGLNWIYQLSQLHVSHELPHKEIVSQTQKSELKQSIQTITKNLELQFESQHPLSLDLPMGPQSFEPELQTHPYYAFIQWFYTIFALRVHFSEQRQDLLPVLNLLFTDKVFTFRNRFDGHKPLMMGWNGESPEIIVHEGSGRKKDFKTYIESLKDLKKMYKSLQVAVYIANAYEHDTLTEYRTLNEQGMFRKKTGFIKLQLTDGLFLILVEQDFKNFILRAPEIQMAK